MAPKEIFAAVLMGLCAVASGQHDDERGDPGVLFKGAMEETDFEEQAIGLQEIVKGYPRSIWADDALWFLGEMYMQKGDLSKAAEFKLKLLEKYPLGRCHLERYTQRQNVYKKSLVPSLKQAFVEMGRVTVERGMRYSVARKSQSRLISNPVPSAVYYDLAQIYRRQGNYVKACRYYQRCIQTLPPEGYLTQFVREGYVEARELADVQKMMQASKTGKKRRRPAVSAKERLRERLLNARP